MKGLIASIAGLAFALCRIDPGFGQEMLTIKPDKPIICYQNDGDRHDHIGVSDRFKALRQQGAARTKSATIEVEYVNFPADNQAKIAFQFAVDIWESELVSAVPIRVRAEWRPLGAGVLGQAIWGSAHANFGSPQFVNVFYPVALAEKIAGHELNDPTEPDIFASFNSNASWYFETDGNTPAGKMDMVTIVLHEIAHGLGYTDTYDVVGSQGAVGLENGGSLVPFVFDLFVENQADKSLVQYFQSPSEALAAELQSSQLYFNSPLSAAALGGVRPKLYAPSVFDNGSSISHLDEATFNSSQDANRLMTPAISAAESIHDLGTVLRATLADMGWAYTLIDHEPLKDTERKDGQPFPVKVRIISDNDYNPATVKLHYSTNGVSFTTVNMTPTANPDEYQSSIPGTTFDRAYVYYISVSDQQQRPFSNPGMIWEVGEEPEQGTHFFRVGPDTDAPVIEHDPVRFLSEGGSLSLAARVTDNQGIAEVIVEYKVNDGITQTVVMKKVGQSDDFEVVINIADVSAADEVRYRLLATDISSAANTAANPTDDFFTVDVTGILPVRDSYSNSFNKPSTDFFGDSFAILTPQGFSNGAIHTNHPYSNGTGPNSESSQTYQLQIPIRIREEGAVIRFDEIVLVEPGENGAVFGDQGFYDYVVVEGSSDGGVSWKPFADGYDSRSQQVWLTRYESAMSGDNSQAKGDSTLYRTQTIDMLESGDFHPGNHVLIRFRLFSDQLAHGWGWAIDNLEIQPTVTGIKETLTPEFNIYPVPANRELFIDWKSHATGVSRVDIADALGRTVFSYPVNSPDSGAVHLAVDLSGLEDGLYIVKAISSRGVLTRKFLKATK